MAKARPTPVDVDPSTLDQSKTRMSVGIACVALIDGVYKVLLISKRYSYAFNEFVHGKYTMNHHCLKRLFDGMYLEDKACILSRDFSRMYDRVWMEPNHRPPNYLSLKRVFESRWMSDGFVHLNKLITESHVSRPVWEIPKGRKRKAESDVACAVREFQEETGMGINSYKLYQGRRTYSHTDASITYINTYYIAFCKNPTLDLLSFRNRTQLDEISDIRWMSIEDIRTHDTSGNLPKFCKSIVGYVKNRIRS